MTDLEVIDVGVGGPEQEIVFAITKDHETYRGHYIKKYSASGSWIDLEDAGQDSTPIAPRVIKVTYAGLPVVLSESGEIFLRDGIYWN